MSASYSAAMVRAGPTASSARAEPSKGTRTRRPAILRNYPVVGHLRFLLEGVGPELRQYIVTDNDQEKPFSRDQRRWVYTSAKASDRFFGFGTDNDLEHAANYVIVKPSAFPLSAPAEEPAPPS